MYDEARKCVWKNGRFYGEIWCSPRVGIDSVFVTDEPMRCTRHEIPWCKMFAYVMHF